MFEWRSWIGLALAAVIALASVAVVITVLSLALRMAARRHEWPKALASSARYPLRLLLLVCALGGAVLATLPEPEWVDATGHGFLIAAIIAAAWLVGALVSFALTATMAGFRIDVSDNLVARRRRTQLTIVRRLAIAAITVLAVGGILLTFPGVQAVGASVLASAGVVSIVAGLAAQSTLANVFAGIQLAFNDAVRVDDVVIVEGEWGRIEEITLTYVVVHIWDDRRMVLPSTYFTTTPFQNWTRRSSELLGSVELDLDWRVSPSAMRTELDEILSRTTLWDGRTAVLQVTDAVGGQVRIRILVTAIDAPTLFDLRCFIREELVEWLHSTDAAALPVTRVQLVQPRDGVDERGSAEQSGLFTGSPDGEERAAHFTAATPVTTPET
jgi:small-conductance mechanosensitive channel